MIIILSMNENKNLKTKNTIAKILQIVGLFIMILSQILAIPFLIATICLTYKREDVDMNYTFFETLLLSIICFIYIIINFI